MTRDCFTLSAQYSITNPDDALDGVFTREGLESRSSQGDTPTNPKAGRTQQITEARHPGATEATDSPLMNFAPTPRHHIATSVAESAASVALPSPTASEEAQLYDSDAGIPNI